MTSGHALCSAGPDVVTEDVIATHAGHSVPVRRYLAPDERAVLVYAHGGGWVTGDLEYADEVCRFLARDSQCTVVSVDYRLAPEHPFPAGLDDVLTAYRWACAAGRPVALGGDSSGGNLAAAAALLLRDDGLLPAFAVLAYPVLDHDFGRGSYEENANAFPVGAADLRWFFDHYAPTEARDDPRVAPLRATDLSGLPRTHLVTVGHDPLRDEGRAYIAALTDAGVDTTEVHHPDLCHGFLRFTGASRAAAAARDDVVSAVAALAVATPVDAGVRGRPPNHAYDSSRRLHHPRPTSGNLQGDIR